MKARAGGTVATLAVVFGCDPLLLAQPAQALADAGFESGPRGGRSISLRAAGEVNSTFTVFSAVAVLMDKG